MTTLELLQPESVEETVRLLGEHGDESKLIAGGTAMVIMLKNRLIAPEVLISLGRVQGLGGIAHEPGTGLRIGALATLREAELSPVVRGLNPTLASTFGKVANVRVRNAATVGGNLSEADYASDPPAILVAMRGRVRAVSPRGEREIPLTGFFRDFYETALEPDELLTELIVPDLDAWTRSAYIKYVTRSSEDRPCVGTAAVVELNADGTCRDLRVAVCAVAETPQEVPSAEAMARGRHLTEELLDEIADAYASAIEPLSDLRGSEWYRRRMIRVFVRRAIQQALASGNGSG